MKQTTSKLSEKPFVLVGYTIDDYVRWCIKNNFKSYFYFIYYLDNFGLLLNFHI